MTQHQDTPTNIGTGFSENSTFKFNNNYSKALSQFDELYLNFACFEPSSFTFIYFFFLLPIVHVVSSLSLSLSMPIVFHIFIIFHQHSFDVQLYFFFQSTQVGGEQKCKKHTKKKNRVLSLMYGQIRLQLRSHWL